MLKVEKAGLFPEKMDVRKDRHSSLVFWFFCIDSYQYWLMSYLYVSHISHPSKYTYGHLSTVLIQHVQVQVWKKKNLYIICFMFSPSTVSSLWINKNIKNTQVRTLTKGAVSPAVFCWQLEGVVATGEKGLGFKASGVLKGGFHWRGLTNLHLPPPVPLPPPISTYPRKNCRVNK